MRTVRGSAPLRATMMNGNAAAQKAIPSAPLRTTSVPALSFCHMVNTGEHAAAHHPAAFYRQGGGAGFIKPTPQHTFTPAAICPGHGSTKSRIGAICADAGGKQLY